MSVRTDEVLLSRTEFREGVFARDGHKCVFCDQPAVDAHHILERRLFSASQQGGYFLSNGASVCGQHHLECEMTLISVEDVREACNIQKWTIPDHLYDDHIYDKWGNVILPNGTRMMGELFLDESVQKILKLGGVLGSFTNRVKYQRTFHVPDSPGIHDDDKMLPDYSMYEGEEVVITRKMDGENTAMYHDFIHARSIDGRSHPSRDWVKQFHSSIAYMIPETFRIYGENLYAKHSLAYDDLPSFFMGFQVWDQLTCLGYDETLLYFELLGIEPVPELWRGTFNRAELVKIAKTIDTSINEGFVMRKTRQFQYGEFRTSVAKWVRPNHVQTNKHWKYGQAVVPNGLSTKSK